MNLKVKLSDTLELPRDIVLNLPSIRVIGKNDIYVENHKGIVEYTNEILRVSTEVGIIKFIGKNFIIKEINRDELFILGEISIIEFAN